jgi:carbon monoxide dehydrogenase subunit G
VAVVTRVFTVRPPVGTVVDYLKDFAHAEQWDPGTLRCVREDAGPVRVGSRWRNASVFMGRTTELDYRLERLEDDRLVFAGSNRSATSRDDLSFAAQTDGTRITYRAEITLLGPLRLVGPLLRRPLRHLADKVVAQMTQVINEL